MDINNQKDKKAAPALTLDVDLYQHYLDNSDLTQEEKIEFLQALWNLINEFKNLTNCSLLINTSFNVRGEPIVCSPSDALNCFEKTEMDILVLENFVVEKGK